MFSTAGRSRGDTFMSEPNWLFRFISSVIQQTCFLHNFSKARVVAHRVEEGIDSKKICFIRICDICEIVQLRQSTLLLPQKVVSDSSKRIDRRRSVLLQDPASSCTIALPSVQ